MVLENYEWASYVQPLNSSLSKRTNIILPRKTVEKETPKNIKNMRRFEFFVLEDDVVVDLKVMSSEKIRKQFLRH